MDLLLVTLRLSLPIALGAVGVSLCERAGVLNLGIEGMMLFGAMAAVVGSHFTKSPWMGILIAILIGGVIGWLHALFSLRFRGNQNVIGVGLNLLAQGLTIVIIRAIWGKDGASDTVSSIESISIPVLKEIPIIGQIFENQTPILFLSIVLFIIIAFFYNRTKFGLRLVAIGDDPIAVQSVGVDVDRMRYFAVTICGMLSALGGAYLSLGQNNLFVSDMVSGRGFMAIAANIFGGWNPVGSIFASLVFGFAQGIRLSLSSLNMPDEFVQMFPYLITLLVLVFISGKRKARAPQAIGQLLDNK